MSLVTLTEVFKSYGYQDVLTGVSFFIPPGRKVGLIGANGAGKSTILRLITGQESADAGRVTLQPNTLVGLLSQEPLLGDVRTILAAAQRPTPELQQVWAEMTALETEALEDEAALERYDDLHHRYQDLGGYECENRAKKILVGLGFPEEVWAKSVSVLSGGERTRLALAQILVRQPDLLLLDEPTNHIDWQISEWLQDYLRRYPGAALMISHDRYFLDAVAEEIVELEQGRVRVYTGNYSAYAKKKAFEREQAEEAYRRTQEEIERQQAIIQHLRSHRKFNSMHSRERVLEKLQNELDEIPREGGRDQRGMKVHARDVAASGREVLSVRELQFGYGEGPLFSGLSFHLSRGDRLAIIGPNGAGKTTLLKVLAGEFQAQSGLLTYGFRVKPAYFAQDLSILDPEATVYDTIWDTGATDHPQTMQALHQFLFKGDEIFKKVGDLSGGERTRLALCRLIVTRPNLLLLDEPTNHLDIASREAVERALCDYPGTLITVSHDRYFLDAVATRLLEIRPGGHTFYEGSYGHYQEKQNTVAAAATPNRSASAKTGTPPKGPSSSAPKARTVSPSKRLPKLEAEIARAEARLKEITGILSDAAGWTEGQDPLTLTAEYEQLSGSLEALYQEWEELAAQVSNK